MTEPAVEQEIEAEIENESYCTADSGAIHEGSPYHDRLTRVALSILLMRDGSTIVGVHTGPVPPEKFDAAQGIKLAREHAIEQVRSRLRDKLAVA